MEIARERLAQAEAFFIHKEYANAGLEAYEAMAQAARVPLYATLVDPFTSEQAIWEFENVFVRSGRLNSEWLGFAEKAEAEKKAEGTEARAQSLIAFAKKVLAEAERLHTEIMQTTSQK
ncbi:MAG: hypothetical protein HY447_02240 [Candidatus Omnitrophica bacterium]|nr:hypothetical protein [Candidatus Omnitrophota bacterium]